MSYRRSAATAVRSSLESLESRVHLAADLVVTAIKYPVGVYNPGQTISGTVTVKNVGDTTTPTFATTIALSANAIFGDGDSLVTTFDQPGLAKGKSRVAKFTGTIVTGIPFGAYRLVA